MESDYGSGGNRLDLGAGIAIGSVNNFIVSGGRSAYTANYNLVHQGAQPPFWNCPSRSGNRRSSTNANGSPSARVMNTFDYGQVISAAPSYPYGPWYFYQVLCFTPSETSLTGSDRCGGYMTTAPLEDRKSWNMLTLALGRKFEVDTTIVTYDGITASFTAGRGRMNAVTVASSAPSPLLSGPLQGWTPRHRTGDVQDGLSKTAMLAERHIPDNNLGWFNGAFDAQPGRWTWGNQPCDGPPWPGQNQYANCSSMAGVVFHPLAGIARSSSETPGTWTRLPGSSHPDALNILMGDGAVRTISKATDGTLLYRLGHMSDGQTIGDF